MANRKLTKRVVDAAKPHEKMYELRDCEVTGFGVRVWPSGSKTYFFSYKMPKRFGSRQGFVTIGEHGSPWTVDRAREEAAKLSHAVKHLGHDVQLQRKAEEDDAVTLAFDRYAELFIERYLAIKWERFHKEGARLLRREAVPHFRNKPLPAISKRDVTAFLDSLSDRPGIAKNTSTALRKMFNWAESRGDISISPMLRIELPQAPASRDRYLDDGELKALWAATLRLNHTYGALIRSLILTGQRRDEISEMQWEELDLSTGIWTIPGSRTKNKENHEVPLSPMFLAELNAQPSRTGWVFTVTGNGPFRNWTYWKDKIDLAFAEEIKARGGTAPDDWKLHDLRRSVGTGLQRLGINRDWIEVTQNRALTGHVASIYQRHGFLPEKVEALATWERHLASLIAEDQIKHGVTALAA